MFLVACKLKDGRHTAIKMTGKRYSVPRGILVLLLCSEVCAVQSTDPGAAVSPSTPGVLPSPLNEAASATGAPRLTPTPNSPLSASLSSTTSTLTATSLTRKVSSTSHLEGTPAPSPQPSASNSAVAVLTGATTLLPVPTQSPGPLNEGKGACMLLYLTGILTFIVHICTYF